MISRIFGSFYHGHISHQLPHFSPFIIFHDKLEPTNHLDLETTEALIEALQQFNGGILLVSHDQHLLNKVLRLQGGMANEAFEAYKKAIVQGKR